MRKFLWLSACLWVLATACSKNDSYNPDEQLRIDESKIKEYLQKNSIAAVRDSLTGVYYQVLKPGNGKDTIADNSTMKVIYTGKLLDGTTFDSSKGDTTNLGGALLNQMILGWRIGLPKISKGGKMLLFIPSVWGYENRQVGSIPPNSVLLFDVELIDFGTVR